MPKYILLLALVNWFICMLCVDKNIILFIGLGCDAVSMQLHKLFLCALFVWSDDCLLFRAVEMALYELYVIWLMTDPLNVSKQDWLLWLKCILKLFTFSDESYKNR